MITFHSTLSKIVRLRGVEVLARSTHPFVAMSGNGAVSCHATRPALKGVGQYVSEDMLHNVAPDGGPAVGAGGVPEYIHVSFDLMDHVTLEMGASRDYHNTLHIGNVSIEVHCSHDQLAIDRKGRIWAAHGICRVFDLDTSHILSPEWTLIGTTFPPGFPKLKNLFAK